MNTAQILQQWQGTGLQVEIEPTETWVERHSSELFDAILLASDEWSLAYATGVAHGTLNGWEMCGHGTARELRRMHAVVERLSRDRAADMAAARRQAGVAV